MVLIKERDKGTFLPLTSMDIIKGLYRCYGLNCPPKIRMMKP